jgi:methyltransferase family protein
VASYLEIGARHGDTFHAVMSSLPIGSTGVAVDWPGSVWGTDSQACLEKACEDLRQQGYVIELIIGDSLGRDAVLSVQAQAPFDAIFIDGDHRYLGVLGDWLNYGKLGKIVAFHDIDGEGLIDKKTGNQVEVPRLWQEIKPRFPHRELIGAQRGMGIGILFQDGAIV